MIVLVKRSHTSFLCRSKYDVCQLVRRRRRTRRVVKINTVCWPTAVRQYRCSVFEGADSHHGGLGICVNSGLHKIGNSLSYHFEALRPRPVPIMCEIESRAILLESGQDLGAPDMPSEGN